MAKFDEEAYLKRIQAEVAAEQAREAQRERDGKMDRSAEEEFANLFGLTVEEARKELSKGIPEVTEKDVEQAMAYIAKGKLNKSVVKKVAKAAKKSKGCVVVLVLGSGVLLPFLALIYGAAEALASVLR